MPKTTDVPHELREFNKVFETISYRHGWGDVYVDFVDYSVACFLNTGDLKVADFLKKKYGKDYGYFKELLGEWLKAQHKQLNRGKMWYDALGAFYEVIASSSKASHLGQFFTPPDVVDMLTMITADKAREGGRQRIADPCSGSGRMLVSFHAHFPGNYCFAADVDAICTKMTALNMMLHGCEGQAVCMNSLDPDDWRFGYNVNPWIREFGGLPHLARIEKEQCFQWRGFQQDKEKYAQRKAEAAAAQKEALTAVKPEPVMGKFGQLSFL
ncbi:N-6 DNA methylase [Runella slithyformis]|uniref:site-specific DNA-methyltransferase (adenine-specific) n=1 Tax=Runella slithyformis (strain ATCC 29530 / DSM 19594 / LMG 11500 / NCIMB 11436 / LSU 4) TaxID=761193 RepID=A0A7U4E482_RUNSL|nr:N-6 DNA methylase [Runella slithyformis]AEI46784.1 N-6 DNA methylase [Runella slithyformis DSM 19594]